MKLNILIILFIIVPFTKVYSQITNSLLRKTYRNIKIAESDTNYTTKREKALNNAFNFYNQTIAKDSTILSDSIFVMQATTLKKLFTKQGVFYFNEAEKSCKTEQYLKAANELEKALKIDESVKNMEDTAFNKSLVYYYTAIILQKGKDFQKAQDLYINCIDKEYEGGAPFSGLSSLYKETGDTINELAVLLNGYQKYPQSKEIIISLINYYLVSGNMMNALSYINKTIEITPENKSLYYTRGTIYDSEAKSYLDTTKSDKQSEYQKEAILNYNQAIHLDSNYFEALYNLGAIYFNSSVKIMYDIQSSTVHPRDQFQKAMESEKKLIIKSLPYFEKAHIINPLDKSTIEVLIKIYEKLRLTAQKENAQKLLNGEPDAKITPVSNLETLIYKEEMIEEK